MPTQTRRRGVLRWRGVVKGKGKTLRSKWFGQGEKERRKAILWEEDQKKLIQEESKKKPAIPTVSLVAWGTSYLNDVKRRHSKLNYLLQRASFRRLSVSIGGDCEISQITPPRSLSFLQERFDSCSGYAANRDRLILARAWEWGRKFIEGFPALMLNPFYAVDRFKETHESRYVPSEEDFFTVLDFSQGQDKVMLTAFLHLAARRSEIFGLKWSDVNFRDAVVTLKTCKTKDGSLREDHIPMSKELRRTLLHWWQNRPLKSSEYVFTMLENAYAADRSPGDPFTSRCHFMKKLCHRSGVKPFGFHAIRHFSAVTLYRGGEEVYKIQKVLRHRDATTTNNYLKSLGFESRTYGHQWRFFLKVRQRLSLCPKRLKPFERLLKRLQVIHLVYPPGIPRSRSHATY